MGILIRYFLDNLFGRQLLDEEGIVGLRRVLIFAATGGVSIALYLPRILHRKYADLDGMAGPEPYRQALLADSFLMICLIVMLAALVSALVAPAMFPSEVDYVTLTPLPLSRRRIFGAKIAAVLVFAGTLILSVVIFFAISFPLFTDSRWAEHSPVLRIAAFAAATAAGAAFSFLAVMAVQGLILTVLPRAWVTQASMVLQSAVIAALILTTPLVFDLATPEDWRKGWQADWRLFPPAWFLGLEQMVLGRPDESILTLGRIGIIGPSAAAAIAIACFGWLYRKPERLSSLPPKPPTAVGLAPVASTEPDLRNLEGGRVFRPGKSRHGGAWTAVWVFVTSTLARNRLPQLVFLIAWSAGLAIVVNDLQDALRRIELGQRDAEAVLTSTVVGMPFVLLLLAVAGLRAAFQLPVSLSANWMFRVTDFPSARSERLDAVKHSLIRLAILPALVLSAPVQIYALGWTEGLSAVWLSTLASVVLLEFVLTGLRRVPFTCTWLPGKRPLPFAVMTVLFTIWLMLTAADVVTVALRHQLRGVIVLSIVFAGAALILRLWRKRSWARDPLEFEDEPFDRLQKLGLGPS